MHCVGAVGTVGAWLRAALLAHRRRRRRGERLAALDELAEGAAAPAALAAEDGLLARGQRPALEELEELVLLHPVRIVGIEHAPERLEGDLREGALLDLQLLARHRLQLVERDEARAVLVDLCVHRAACACHAHAHTRGARESHGHGHERMRACTRPRRAHARAAAPCGHAAHTSLKRCAHDVALLACLLPFCRLASRPSLYRRESAVSSRPSGSSTPASSSSLRISAVGCDAIASAEVRACAARTRQRIA